MEFLKLANVPAEREKKLRIQRSVVNVSNAGEFSTPFVSMLTNTVADAGSEVFRYSHLVNKFLCLSCREHVEWVLQLEY